MDVLVCKNVSGSAAVGERNDENRPLLTSIVAVVVLFSFERSIGYMYALIVLLTNRTFRYLGGKKKDVSMVGRMSA